MKGMPSLSADKYLLTLHGIPFGKCRKPFRPLTKAEMKTLDEVYEKYLLKGYSSAK